MLRFHPTSESLELSEKRRPFPFSSLSKGLLYAKTHSGKEFKAAPRGSFLTALDGAGGGVIDIGPASDEGVVRVSVDAAGVVRRIQVLPVFGGPDDGKGEDVGLRDSSAPLVDRDTGKIDVDGCPGKPEADEQERNDVEACVIYPAKHHVVSRGEMDKVLKAITAEMEERCLQMGREGRVLEAERLRQRTENDLLLLDAVGTCKVWCGARAVLSLRLLLSELSPRSQRVA